MQIKSVWDNGGITIDRYTVFVKEDNEMCLGVSANPKEFSQWDSGIEGSHLGKKIPFNKLPQNVQEHILEHLAGE